MVWLDLLLDSPPSNKFVEVVREILIKTGAIAQRSRLDILEVPCA
jgi:hypothetical protein